MNKLDITPLIQHYCQLAKQWAVVLFIPFEDDLSEIVKSIPFITCEDHQAISDGLMIVMCDSLEEHWKVFNSIVCKDGPTVWNSYDGPCKTYAYTIGPCGNILTENT